MVNRITSSELRTSHDESNYPRRCLGTSQHLKNKYGGGYMLEIKLKVRGQLKSMLRAKLQYCFPLQYGFLL